MRIWIHSGYLRIARSKIHFNIYELLGNRSPTMATTGFCSFLPVQTELVIARLVQISNLNVRLFADLFDDGQAQPIVLAVGFFFIKSPEDSFFVQGFQQAGIAYSKL